MQDLPTRKCLSYSGNVLTHRVHRGKLQSGHRLVDILSLPTGPSRKVSDLWAGRSCFVRPAATDCRGRVLACAARVQPQLRSNMSSVSSSGSSRGSSDCNSSESSSGIRAVAAAAARSAAALVWVRAVAAACAQHFVRLLRSLSSPSVRRPCSICAPSSASICPDTGMVMPRTCPVGR